MRKRAGFGSIVLAATLLAVIGVSAAQQPAPGTAAEGARAPAVDPQAMAALDKMGAFLRTLRAFEVRSDTTKDEVLDTGQKIQFGATVDLRVRRPDRLRADVSSSRKQRQFFYDGKTFTMYGQRVKYYASVPAQGTIRELLKIANERYGLELPLADLFFWGTDQARLDDIKAAMVVGADRIGDVICDHYAFRQDGVDWQIWIESGKVPLPRKLVITTTADEAQPQYVALLTWNLSPKLDDKVFTFVPPKDAHPIVFRTPDAQD